jgi:hypothetical protein
MNVRVSGVFALDVDKLGGRQPNDPVAIRMCHLMPFPASGEFPDERMAVEAPTTDCVWSPPTWRPDEPVICGEREVDHLLGM